MNKNKSGVRGANLSRRAFMEFAGSSLAPFALPMVGYSLSADPPKTERKSSAENKQTLTLYEDSFFYGRRYFIIRSGGATMILQADHADLGPAARPAPAPGLGSHSRGR